MFDKIELKNIQKSFMVEDRIIEVLNGFNLSVPKKAITVVLGKSGCGKTTLLRMVGELDADYKGNIEYPAYSKMAFVFQEPRLMPWLNVWKNITFGLKSNDINPVEIQALIDLTGLTGFERASPAQLSGGMSQRVAIARALALNPRFILMDEPFAALDYFTRANMQNTLLKIQETNDCGVLFVTHSIDEALAIGDNIVIIADKKVKKVYHLKEKAKTCNKTAQEIVDIKEDILKNII